jgi:phosphatidylserine/phosphatidylglycerophosphate/cardiolipin synthase-like enzyme
MEVRPPVVDAMQDAAARGVAARLVYNEDHARPIPVPPPPSTSPDLLHSLGIPLRAIPGVPDLMHHKYVVRDGRDVWTGSMNWTDDSWTREENVVLTLSSPEVASAFTQDFEDLWSKGEVVGTGAFDRPAAMVGAGAVRAWFAPGRGRRMAHRIATAIGRAERRVRVCSPVVTAGPILGTLADLASSGRVDLAGVCDGTQMIEVLGQWVANPASSWKVPAFRCLVEKAPFSGKRSTPYGPGTVHDYMHAKVVVSDDIVFVGSYNLSGSGEENAENVLEIKDGELAEVMVQFIDSIRARDPAFVLDP